MRVSCVICDEFLQPQDVTATPCGHTFHTRCITRWLVRSRSCPQCRSKTTERTLNKLYFDSADTEGEPDPDLLQQEIDHLKYEVTIKDQAIEQYTKDLTELRAQAEVYREDFKKCDTLLEVKNASVLHLQQQVQQYVQQYGQLLEESKKARSDITGLREGTERLKEELRKSIDARDSLRAELRDTTNKYEEAMQLGKGLKEEMQVVLNTTVRQLEQENESLEYERDSLRKKIRELELAVLSSDDDNRSIWVPGPALCQHDADGCHSHTPQVSRKRKRSRQSSEPQEQAVLETIDLDTSSEEEQERSREVEVIDLVTTVQEDQEEEEEEELYEVEIIGRVAAPPPKKRWMKKTLSGTIRSMVPVS